MSRLTGIHHINFLFADLDAAVTRFKDLLGDCEFIFEDLPLRGVRTARTMVGETWFVLVSPVDRDADTVPAKHLREKGEGFFLLSFGVDDLEWAIDTLGVPKDVREGLDHWRIVDVPVENTLGVPIQLTETGKGGAD